MREIRLTPYARVELGDVRRYSHRVWGAAQAKRYLAGLGDRFEQIAAGTAVHRDAGIGKDYRRCRYERHIIIFTEESDLVRIVHIFHEWTSPAGLPTMAESYSTQSSPISR